MPARWVYPPTHPFLVQGRDLSEDNFAQEERTNLDILIREALQNPIDARASDNIGPVQVRMAVLQPGSYEDRYLNALLPDEYCRRLGAAGGDSLPETGSRSVLVIEDFGTTGLQGTWENQNADGPGENWNAFWFREGEGAKASAGSNGRAGQGKITYYRVGAARAVFGLTIRKDDGKSLLMGRSAFRRAYAFGTGKYLRHSFWCSGTDIPLPTTAAADIAEFRKAFALKRKDEPGLSLVIPVPIDFIPKDAIQTIVAEFYFPVVAGRLEVSIGGLDITASTIESITQNVLSDSAVAQRKSGFTRGFRRLVREVLTAEDSDSRIELKAGWDKPSSIEEDALPPESLAKLRAAAEAGKRISIRCPIAVRPKRGEPVASWFDVHLEIPDDLERSEEAYIRRDLLIGSERHLGNATHLQKARALTLVTDPALSAFLADAEEPTHLKWNASRPRLAEDYSNPAATLRAVRNAAPRILALVTNGLIRRDVKALAQYFRRPVDAHRRPTGGGGKPQGDGPESPEIPPPTPRKPFRIVADADRVRVLPNGGAAPTAQDLPLKCTLEIAYEGLDQNPFKSYDPFDFDLADVGAHAVAARGTRILNKSQNRIAFEVVEPDFLLEVPGFDPNIRLRARLSYEETDGGKTVSEE